MASNESHRLDGAPACYWMLDGAPCRRVARWCVELDPAGDRPGEIVHVCPSHLLPLLRRPALAARLVAVLGLGVSDACAKCSGAEVMA
jgi:hypothetical protein